MDWIPVSSSAMSRIAYFNGEIYIDWKEVGRNNIYAYRAPLEIFEGLLYAPSHGIYANTVVKQYPYRRLAA